MEEKELKNYLNIISKEGFSALQSGDSIVALEKFEIILSKYPNNPKILSLTSLCYYNLNNFNKAKEYISQAISNSPSEIGFYINKGNILLKMKKYDEAEAVYKDALKLNSQSSELFYNFGVLYSDQHKYTKAIIFYNKSLKISQSNKFVFNNLGVAFKELGYYEKAKKNFNKAIALDNSFSEGKYNLGITILLTNPNKTAWEYYELRKKINNERKKQLNYINIKKWDGSSLTNKILIIYSEQGIGDNVQFARYIKLIKKENTKIIFYTTKKLEFLFHKMIEVDEIIFNLHDVRRADYCISIMSLPYIFRFNKKLPEPYNFFQINKEDNKFWKNKINQNKLLKVGLMWQGDSNLNKEDYKRSIPLSKFESILQIQNIEFISLQKDMGRKQITSNNYQNLITDFFGNIDKIPFKDTLALIENLDIIITIDTSVGHIAATLEKETWIMLPYVPDFRWGIKDTNSHWYNKVRLFRQHKINSWDEVIVDIKKLLELNLNNKIN